MPQCKSKMEWKEKCGNERKRLVAGGIIQNLVIWGHFDGQLTSRGELSCWLVLVVLVKPKQCKGNKGKRKCEREGAQGAY